MKNHSRIHIIRMRRMRVLIIAAVTAALVIAAAACIYIGLNIIHIEYDSAEFSESAKEFNNPYRGWYCLYGYRLTSGGYDASSGGVTDNPDNSATPAVSNLTSKLELETDRDPQSNRLVLVEINLAAFRDSQIDGQGLAQIDTILSAWERTGKSIILRFLYDWDGLAAQTEPDSIDTIMQHMRDTADIVNRHSGSIYTMQGLFTGNCGEMTGSRYMSSDNIQTLARCLASSTLPSIKLAVRTPAQWRTIPQDCSYRFGLFNDGITGSVYDLGTYSDRTVTSDYTSRWTRTDELAFQNNLCRHAPNGGEAVIDNIYNDYPNVITDLSTMGISYLNSMHDAAVLNKWKSVTYNTVDISEADIDKNTVYNGISVYDYISLHLGYRYLVTGSSLEAVRFPGALRKMRTLTVNIRNTGFAGCYNDFDLNVTLYNNENTAAAVLTPDAFDMKGLAGGSCANVTFTFDSSQLADGAYTAVLTCTDRMTGEIIYFSNANDSENGGVMVGYIKKGHAW